MTSNKNIMDPFLQHQRHLTRRQFFGRAATGIRLQGTFAHREAAVGEAAQAVQELIESARIGLEEAGRALRNYRDRLELDPAELAATEERLAALHDAARRHRVRPDDLPELLYARDQGIQRRIQLLDGLLGAFGGEGGDDGEEEGGEELHG